MQTIEITNALDLIHSGDIEKSSKLAEYLHQITTSEGTKLREVPAEILETLILDRRVLIACVRNGVGKTFTENIAGVVRVENRGEKWEEFCGMHVREDFRGKQTKVGIAGKPQEFPSYLFEFTNSSQRELKPTEGTLAEHLMLAGLKRIYHGNHEIGLLHPLDTSHKKSGAMLVTQLLGNPKMVKLAASFGLVPLYIDDVSQGKIDKGIDEVIQRSIQEDLRDLVEAGNRILMFSKFHLSPEMLALAQTYREHLKKIIRNFTGIEKNIGDVLRNI